MFDKGFSLSKSSWHAKLMKFVWGFKPEDFSHMCPYFWLTIFNLFIIIPFAPFKLIWLGLTWVFDTFDNMARMKKQESKEKLHAYVDTLTPEHPDLPLIVRGSYSRYNAIIDYLFFTKMDDSKRRPLLEKLMDLMEEYRAENSVKQREIDAKKLSNKQRINKILNFIKPVTTILLYAIGIAAVIGVVWLIGSLIILLVSEPAALSVFLSVLGAIGVVVALGFGVFLLVSYLHSDDSEEKEDNKFLMALGSPFRWIGRGFVKLADIIVTIYRNSCPPIDWK